MGYGDHPLNRIAPTTGMATFAVSGTVEVTTASGGATSYCRSFITDADGAVQLVTRDEQERFDEAQDVRATVTTVPLLAGVEYQGECSAFIAAGTTATNITIKW